MLVDSAIFFHGCIFWLGGVPGIDAYIHLEERDQRCVQFVHLDRFGEEFIDPSLAGFVLVDIFFQRGEHEDKGMSVAGEGLFLFP